jgi:polyisoprenoid-binding protein YceI
MPTYDATTATCHVFTFKEGVLSAVAHDLRIRVERFTIEIDEAAGTVVARVSASSLRVDCAMKDGRESFDALSDRNKREIEGNIEGEVLHAKRHPEIVFRSTKIDRGLEGLEADGDERHIEGTLSLHGTERPLRVTARRQAGRWTAEVELHQPDFGIKPYSAMLGTLKVRPVVRVRVSVPA